MTRPIYVVNDALTQIPGSRTLWHDLVDWTGGEFVPAEMARSLDGLVIRNASYFGPLATTGPTIALLQDLMPPGHPGRPTQVEVCQRANLIVANSTWTLAQYPELAGLPHRIIPLPVDFDLFKPRDDGGATVRAFYQIAPESICWVGAASYIKGWDILHRVIGLTDHPFVVVRKDCDSGPDSGWGGRVRYFYRRTQKDLAEIMGACKVGLCTSRVETQHLAGIEMAACGLPVVGIYPVGVYAEEPVWCVVAGEEKLLGMLKAALAQAETNRDGTRKAALHGPWTKEACRVAWMEAVASV